jgi:hypothetical protein
VREGVSLGAGVRVRVALGEGVAVADAVAVEETVALGRLRGGRPVESKVGRPNGVSWVGVGVSGSCAKPS